MDERTIIVLTGGAPADPRWPLPEAAMVIAADSGLEQAALLGLSVDLLVGDLDSVSEAALADAVEAGTRIERHPPDKDATDLELALTAAQREGATLVVVAGGGGGRIDHLLANAMLLASPAWADLDIEWLVGDARIVALRKEAQFSGQPGDLLTLLAVGGPASGVTTKGLKFPLENEVLLASSTRGVSNELVADKAAVHLNSGVLLAIHQPAISAAS